MDLGNTGNAVARIGVAAVGAYFGGYTGMQVGLALGSVLFHAKEAKKHNPYNDFNKNTNTIIAPDTVPLVIGTDICSGNVIWLNTDTIGMVKPSYYNNQALEDWLESLAEGVDDSVQFFHIEFIAAFATGLHKNNRVWLDDIHFWAWHRFDDWIHYKHNWISNKYPVGSWNSITNMRKTMSWTPWHESNYLNKTHVKSVTPIHWWGAMFLPTPKTMDELTLDKFEDSYGGGKDGSGDGGSGLALIHQGPPKTFPNLKAEISNLSTGDYTIPPYDGSIGDRNHNDYDHCYRDNNSHHFYGILNTGFSEPEEPWYNRTLSIRRLNFYKYNYTLLVSHEETYNTITIGYNNNQSISRQDIDGNPDCLYIFHGRNWYGSDTYDHHHALYSLEYDLFYIDRSDDSVHSVIYRNRINLIGDDSASSPRPMVKIGSMEIVGDYILLFGTEYQSHSIWEDVRSLTADAEYLPGRKTKLYADFSLYPNNYWVDDTGGVYVWAYFNYSYYNDAYVKSSNRFERYRIIEQTATYIIVDGWYGLFPKEGNNLRITRIREFQAGWSIVGEGSTRKKIICNSPSPFEPKISEDLNYKSIQFQNYQPTSGLNWGHVIESISSSSVTLVNTLPNDPVPGEVIWFSYNSSGSGSTDKYEKFTNPQNYWFLENLPYAWGSAPPPLDGSLNSSYIFTGMNARNHYGKNVILVIDKNSGQYINKIYESYFRGFYYGSSYVCTAEYVQVSTVSTDTQIAISFQIVQTYTRISVNNLIIDKDLLSNDFDSLNILSWFHGSHSLDYTFWAVGKIYRGCVKVRAWDDYSNRYSYRWYALVAEFTPEDRSIADYSRSNIGYYLLDLGESGIFPPMNKPLTPTVAKEYSSILGLDANSSNMIKWFRPQISVGALQSPFFLETQSTFRDSQSLRMYDYDEKLFFVLDRGAYVGANAETWCYMMPNEYNKYGFSWPVGQSTNDIDRAWVSGLGTWGDPIASCKYYLGFRGNYFGSHFSNFCDCYLSTAIYKLFQQVPNSYNKPYVETGSYANELIEDKVIYCGKEHNIIEPRFMFSMSWSQKKPLVDMLREILATCQGMYITQCSSSYAGYIKLPNPNETISWNFGYHEQSFLSNQTSSNLNIIYIDLSDYSDDYWRGDFGKLIQNGITYEFLVKKQYINYIELDENLSILSQSGSQIILTKDNMIESSFVFSKKPQYERANRIRIEFVNRLLEYKMDIAEADDIYKQEIIDKRIITKQLELHGIKRATQAARMALRYLDYEQYVNWMCSFQTDLMGVYICYGDIIGITHPITGWFEKPFRVIRKEELDDFNVILECEEYVGGIYHDVSIPIYQGGSHGSVGPSFPISDVPDPVRRLNAHYDQLNNRIYVTFSDPQNNTFFVGANIYYKIDNGDYEFMGLATNSISSVIYSQYYGSSTPSNMEPTRTKYGEMESSAYRHADIPYDPLTMIGSFPASGYLWVNGELIYYGAIDTVHNKFTHVIRNIDTPEYQYAADAPDDVYNWTNPLIVLADTSNAFNFQFDVSAVDLTAERAQTEGSQIQYIIPTITIRADSLNVAGLSNFEEFSPTYSFQLRQSLERPYPPTLLRYSRNY